MYKSDDKRMHSALIIGCDTSTVGTSSAPVEILVAAQQRDHLA